MQANDDDWAAVGQQIKSVLRKHALLPSEIMILQTSKLAVYTSIPMHTYPPYLFTMRRLKRTVNNTQRVERGTYQIIMLHHLYTYSIHNVLHLIRFAPFIPLT